ncbi:MAG: carboxypeptidase-like regulatory domain-containing protein [Prolixibacteraceae bacterium]
MYKQLSNFKTSVFQIKSNLKNVFILILFAGFCFNTQAQVIEITGQVTSKTDGKPLLRAQVLVKGTDASVTTDARGDYTIRANASETLVFSNAGMKT